MAKTYKRHSPNPFRKEAKPYRRAHNKQYRRAVEMAVQRGEEEVPMYRRTSGWLTH